MKCRLLFSAALLAVVSASPPVSVSLRPSWQTQSLLTELIETVALENPRSLFALLDAVLDPSISPPVSTLSPQALNNFILQLASSNGLLSLPGSTARVEMNLALHAAAPKIEAFRHQYLTLADPKCGSWVDWYGQAVCTVEELANLVAAKETIEAEAGADHTLTYPRPKTLAFDHIHPALSAHPRPPRTAILYTNLTSPNTQELHAYLMKKSQGPSPSVEYIFRHAPLAPSETTRSSSLAGYGVALDLKKTDYLAVDDRHSQHSTSSAEGSRAEDSPETTDHILDILASHSSLYDTVNASAPLSEQELKVVGLQAVHLIHSSPSPLYTLKQLSHNFPKYAAAVSRRVNLDGRNIESEVVANSEKVSQGQNLMWINGASVSSKEVNPFGLLRLLQKERVISLSLQSLGLNTTQTFDLITHSAVSSAQSAGSSSVTDGLFDSSDRQEGGAAIVWWNDLEKDKRYEKWSDSIQQILRPLYPGQYHSVKINLFNVVLVLDLSDAKAINLISGSIFNIISRSFPFRFGIVPIVETESGEKMARLFYHLIEAHGRKTTMEYFKALNAALHERPYEEATSAVDWSIAKSIYEQVLGETPKTDLKTLLEEAAQSEAVTKAKAYAKRLAVTLTSTPQGQAFVNGRPIVADEKLFRALPQEIGKQLQYLQEKLYIGQLTETDPTVLSTHFYDLPTTHARRNSYIYPDPANPTSLRVKNLVEEFSKADFSLSSSGYVTPHESEELPLTMLVVADLDSTSGTELVTEALKSITPISKTRLAFVHNPNGSTCINEKCVSKLLFNLMYSRLMSKLSPSTILEKLQHLEESTGIEAEAYSAFTTSGRQLARQLGLRPMEQAVVVNGRIVGPIKDGDFTSEEFTALMDYELMSRTQPVVDALKDVVPGVEQLDRSSSAELFSLASSVVSALQLPDPSESGLFDSPTRPRSKSYSTLDGDHTRFTIGDSATAMYHIAVVLDPLSETAQRWSSYLEWILALPDVFVEVYLHPSFYTEAPLKRFYRYNLPQALAFDEAGIELEANAVFEDLPTEPIYTLAMGVPPSWLVRPREALYDLDNIQLNKLYPEDRETGVSAVFSLDSLVIEGHARESNNMSPPRGLQLQLLEGQDTPVDDTQVVANLGYFQFKAKPGIFKMEIREGRGRSIYEMESVGGDGWDSGTLAMAGDEISVTTFEGLTLYPRVSRRPGMEFEDVLAEEDEDEEASPGILEFLTSKVMSLFGSPSSTTTTDLIVKGDAQAEINIFTVASGLLYERFVGIMILSVLRNTNSTVKFWFIENFLSPSFLEFIPHMAKEYSFQYELVTYKWPSWLRAQKEKQRIIWAYKILFLDVLFPMDLKKVIFVDADQIVRADLKELVDLDLHGAPYGYTPMGDDNTDMEGFRFWKTGYWADFLRGKPYHISALYVVDLVRFRQTAAGDMLRGQYQQLSADPNSLSNLDQDLPNNLQHQVPIFSLPEDWLWCETWCSKDRLHRAKTIDLCQNPLTKEPKLARARQIPEWEQYDSEIAQFGRTLTQKGVLRSRVSSADANVLAEQGAAGYSSSTDANEHEGAVGSSPSSEEQREGGGESDVGDGKGEDKGASEPGRDEL